MHVKDAGPQLGGASFSADHCRCLQALLRSCWGLRCQDSVQASTDGHGRHVQVVSSSALGLGLRCPFVMCHNLNAVSEAAACKPGCAIREQLLSAQCS